MLKYCLNLIMSAGLLKPPDDDGHAWMKDMKIIFSAVK